MVSRTLVSQVVTSLAFGGKTFAYSYFTGGYLVPDTSSYVGGGSCWSSVAACSLGNLGGYPLLFAASVAGSLALGWYLGTVRLAWRVGLFLFPFGMNVSADAIGVALLATAKSWGCKLALPLAATHLVVALVYGFALLTRRFFGQYAGLAGSGVAWMGQGLLGWFHWQQARYLLPGLVIAAFYHSRPIRFRVPQAAGLTAALVSLLTQERSRKMANYPFICSDPGCPCKRGRK